MLQNNNNSKPPDRPTDQPAGQTQQSERRHTQKKKNFAFNTSTKQPTVVINGHNKQTETEEKMLQNKQSKREKIYIIYNNKNKCLL